MAKALKVLGEGQISGPMLGVVDSSNEHLSSTCYDKVKGHTCKQDRVSALKKQGVGGMVSERDRSADNSNTV